MEFSTYFGISSNIPMPEYQIYDTISADGATYLWNQMLHEETK